MRRLLMALVVIGTFVAAAPAAADVGAGAGTTPDGATATVISTGSGSGSTSSSGGSGPPCTYERQDQSELNSDFYPEREGGAYYFITCKIPGPGVSSSLELRIRWIPDSEPVDPRALAEDARASLRLEKPTLRTSPAPDRLLVNLPTWLSVGAADWGPRTATASLNGVSATVTATPIRVVYRMGDGDAGTRGDQAVCDGQGRPRSPWAFAGLCDYVDLHTDDTVVCAGPGRSYNPASPYEAQRSDCAYVYHASSAGQPADSYRLSVTIEWHLTWTAAGAPGGGDLGTDRRTTDVPVRVGEIQAVNARARP